MERVGDGQEKMEGHCSTGQSSQWAVVPMEEEEIFCCQKEVIHRVCHIGVGKYSANSTAIGK